VTSVAAAFVGCKVNQADSDEALARLCASGLSPAARDDADIVVVPLEHGGGTKNKTLEAMAWARPVVGTPQAFTGLAAAPDNAFVVCALDAAAMAATLEELAHDPRRRAEMGAAARRHVLDYHGQERVNELMHGIYEQIER